MFNIHIFRAGPIGLFLLLISFSLFAQDKQEKITAKSNDKTEVHILHTNLSIYSGDTNRLIGNVQVEHEGSIMYCDSAYMDKAHNLEAFSNVRIVQPGNTQASGDYLKYNSSTKMAFMKGNVNLTDGKSNLKCEELNYDLALKSGTFASGGTLQNEGTTVTSNSGFYNTRTKDSRFTGNVHITDPQFDIRSQDLTYNTATKVMEFFSPSVVISDKSVLNTSCGTYDSKNEIADFPCHSSIFSDNQYIEGDTIYYNKLSSYGMANGHVICIDTAQKATLYSGHAEYYRKKRQLWATIKPVLKQMNGKDSLFIRADTFYSAPIPKKNDTLKPVKLTKQEKTAIKKKNKKDKAAEPVSLKPIIPTIDTTAEADSTAPRYFIGYHHVKIFSDSLQGLCDSISYTQSDSILRMMYNPVAWSRNSQITGDTILLKMDSGKLKKIIVPNNATVVSLSGPARAQMYDQVQGKRLDGNFTDNEITDMLVQPNAECIYYSKDEKNAYLGVNQATSERMKILFKERKISKIIFEQDVHQTMTPLSQANIPTLHLSRFQWLEIKRPKKIEELFE